MYRLNSIIDHGKIVTSSDLDIALAVLDLSSTFDGESSKDVIYVLKCIEKDNELRVDYNRFCELCSGEMIVGVHKSSMFKRSVTLISDDTWWLITRAFDVSKYSELIRILGTALIDKNLCNVSFKLDSSGKVILIVSGRDVCPVPIRDSFADFSRLILKYKMVKQ